MTEGKPKQTRKGNRERLMMAALGLIEQDQSGLSGISLRQITKACGLSPPAFYSHFASVEELGLALVEDVGDSLREVLKAVRDAETKEAVIAQSVAAAFSYIRANEALFVLITRERAGNSARLRAAIRCEVRRTVEEVANNFYQLSLFSRFNLEEMHAVVAAIVALGLNLIPDLLDLSRQSKELGDALLAEYEYQIRLMLF